MKRVRVNPYERTIGPEALPQDQNQAEPASVNGKEPEQQAVSEKEQQNETNTVETVETAKEQEHASKTAYCTFSGVVPIDLKRFTNSGVSLVEMSWLWKNAFTLPGQGHPPVQIAHSTQAEDHTDLEALVFIGEK